MCSDNAIQFACHASLEMSYYIYLIVRRIQFQNAHTYFTFEWMLLLTLNKLLFHFYVKQINLFLPFSYRMDHSIGVNHYKALFWAVISGAILFHKFREHELLRISQQNMWCFSPLPSMLFALFWPHWQLNFILLPWLQCVLEKVFVIQTGVEMLY